MASFEKDMREMTYNIIWKRYACNDIWRHLKKYACNDIGRHLKKACENVPSKGLTVAWTQACPRDNIPPLHLIPFYVNRTRSTQSQRLVLGSLDIHLFVRAFIIGLCTLQHSEISTKVDNSQNRSRWIKLPVLYFNRGNKILPCFYIMCVLEIFFSATRFHI